MAENEILSAKDTSSPSPKLDVIRSLAVSLVLLSHVPLGQLLLDLLSGRHDISAQPVGVFGVGIFFVHTCMVLMLSLERQQRAGHGHARMATTFLIRRAFRIYPLSAVVVVVLALVAYFTARELDYSQLATNLLLIQNLTGDPSDPAALWSLPYELQMYLLLPGIYLLVVRRESRAVALVALLWLASVALVLLVKAAGLNHHLIKYLPAFLPGVLAYALTKRTTRGNAFPSCFPALYIGLVAAAFPLLVSAGLPESILLWPTCLALGLIIPYSSEIRSRPVRAAAATIAKYSYGIYLVHGSMADFSFGYLRSTQPVLQWLVFVVGTTVLSFLAFHLVEQPGIRWGKRIARAMRGTEALSLPEIAVRP